MLLNSEISIVHIHGASRGSFYRKFYYYFLIKKVFNKKVIYHIHGGEYHLFIEEAGSFVKKQIGKMIIQSDHVIVLSNFWKEYFTTTFPKGNFSRVYNSIPLVSIDCQFPTSKLVNFLFLGQITEGKGCFDLLEVANQLKQRNIQNFLIQIGGIGNSAKLNKLITEYHLHHNVKFLGWVSGDEKAMLFRESQVFVLPSYNEGLPVSILEAMAYGLPVISTKVGGIPEMIVEGGSGFLTNPGDLENLSQKMEFFIHNREKAFEMGNRSKAIVEEKFSSKRIQSQLLKVYNEILNT